MKIVKFCSAFALLFASAGFAAAGDVEITGVHLCCPACPKAVAAALVDVDGVSGTACDREEKTVSFSATNEETAQAGIDALAEAGFHGAATHGDDDLEFRWMSMKADIGGTLLLWLTMNNLPSGSANC